MKRSHIGPKTYEEFLSARSAQDARKREKGYQRQAEQVNAPEGLNTRKREPLQRRSTFLKRVSDTFRLKNAVWREFSIFIRRRDSTNGWVNCVTCWIELPWKEAHAGHFVAGRGNSGIFDERNVHPQCAHCNVTLSGNLSAYEDFMLKRYGQGVIDELRALRGQTRKWNEGELRELLGRYRAVNKGRSE